MIGGITDEQKEAIYSRLESEKDQLKRINDGYRFESCGDFLFRWPKCSCGKGYLNVLKIREQNKNTKQ